MCCREVITTVKAKIALNSKEHPRPSTHTHTLSYCSLFPQNDFLQQAALFSTFILFQMEKAPNNPGFCYFLPFVFIYIYIFLTKCDIKVALF